MLICTPQVSLIGLGCDSRHTLGYELRVQIRDTALGQKARIAVRLARARMGSNLRRVLKLP